MQNPQQPDEIAQANNSQEKRIIIKTAEQLYSVRYDLSSVYSLEADIDLSGYRDGEGWVPIGSIKIPFTGRFYGNGHVIKNLYINNPKGYHQALFADIDGGVIQDLGLEGVDITTGHTTGSLVGYVNNSTVSGCFAKGTVTGDQWVGGLAGSTHEDSILSKCYTSVTVQGDSALGGIVGKNNESTITECHATGSVNGFGEVGGITGINDKGTIVRCHASGDISSSEYYAGGLVGNNTRKSTILNCSAMGMVNSGDYTGGLVGKNYGVITGSFSTGAINGSCYGTGGLVGSHADGTITDCYSVSNVDGAWETGGLVGQNIAAIIRCFSTGPVQGVSHQTGGFTGNVLGARTDCFFDTESSGQKITRGNGEPRTTGDMKKPETYTNWDFEKIWGIDNSINNGYPYLRENPPRE